MSSLFNGWVMDDKEYQIMKLVEENRELKRLLKEYEVAFKKLKYPRLKQGDSESSHETSLSVSSDAPK